MCSLEIRDIINVLTNDFELKEEVRLLPHFKCIYLQPFDE
jgi:hypothetical protein